MLDMTSNKEEKPGQIYLIGSATALPLKNLFAVDFDLIQFKSRLP